MATSSQNKATITNQATGQSVAEIKKQSWMLKTEYHITVVPGVDLVLVASLCLILHDVQEKSQALLRDGVRISHQVQEESRFGLARLGISHHGVPVRK